MSKLIPAELAELEPRLLDSGLLYALNYLVLHPLGLAIALSYQGDAPEALPTLILMKSDDGTPISFAEDTLDAAREKLKAFLDLAEKERRTPYNELTLLGAINIKSEPEDFERHYQSSEFRSLMGTETVPPLLVRENGQTYLPITKKDFLLALAGKDRYRPGRILSLLEKAWRRDNPYTVDDDVPQVVAMPTWFYSIWATLTQEMPGSTFVGRKFVIGGHEDRIYLTHGAN